MRKSHTASYLNPDAQHTFFARLCRSVTPFSRIYIILLLNLMRLQASCSPFLHRSRRWWALVGVEPSTRPPNPGIRYLFWGGSAIGVFLDWAAAGGGRTVESFLVAQAKTTVQQQCSSAVSRRLTTAASSLRVRIP